MPDGRYMLVCAAVYATISPFNVQCIEDMKIVTQEPDDISVEVIAGIIQKAAATVRGHHRDRGRVL